MKNQNLPRPGRQYTADMTEGSILRHLALFALPLLLGNLFQQLYNTVDTWVVGNFVSNEAFSAVGSMAPAINTLISCFTGLSGGATVIISQFWGARRPDDVRRTVSTALAMTFVMGIVLSGLGILLIPAIMDWIRAPQEVRPFAMTYLTIYFAGLTGLLVYNMGAGILRAVGDSVRPFFFLVISAMLNTGLDLLFVLQFRMGVAGVAWATVITQIIAAGMVLLLLLHTDTCVQWRPRETRIDVSILKQMVRIGMPAAFQLMTMSFSNIFVFGYINSFGTDHMSAWAAYSRLEQFIALPLQSLSLASTTFTAQNIGRGDLRRTRQGTRIACGMAILQAAAVIIPVTLFAPQIVQFFNAKPAVVQYGAQILRTLLAFYWINSISLVYSGALRGAGKTLIPTVIMTATLVVLRQTYLFVMANYICNAIVPIIMAFPVGWCSCSLGVWLYYRRAFLPGSDAAAAKKD